MRPGNVRCMASNASQERLCAHILVKDKALGSSRLDELEAQLAGGASFGAVAQAASECASGKREGVLGWLARDAFYPEFEAAAFAAPIGDIVRASSPLGLHLIKVLEERFVASVQQMSVQELSEVLLNPALLEDVQMIDVREAWEQQTASLPHFRSYRLTQMQVWGPTIAEELDPTKETLVLCHHGVRSMQVSNFLVSKAGFTNVKNITEGIHAYSTLVDRSVPTY
ncbi:hypothetical protein FOA52_002858 [Chlamydomonas sp. UWO 241]|nr:hypothetical protein FOA52_002858 [Chlamydomonas sp. UWO 241]